MMHEHLLGELVVRPAMQIRLARRRTYEWQLCGGLLANDNTVALC